MPTWLTSPSRLGGGFGEQPAGVEELELGSRPAEDGVRDELARVRVFCDDWEQASHNGDLVHAVKAGVVSRSDVTELGPVLAGTASGRRSDAETTVFDSTGLAIQDLAIALASLERVEELDVPIIEL